MKQNQELALSDEAKDALGNVYLVRPSRKRQKDFLICIDGKIGRFEKDTPKSDVKPILYYTRSHGAIK